MSVVAYSVHCTPPEEQLWFVSSTCSRTYRQKYFMPAEASVPSQFHIFNALPGELEAFLAAWNWPKYPGEQVRQWVYRKLITDPVQMSNLPQFDRNRLTEAISFFTAKIAVHQASSDGTEKILLSWPGGASAET